MYTSGFTCGYSDAVTLGEVFVAKDGAGNPLTSPKPVVSTYINVGGTGGGIVYVNSNGYTQWEPNGFVGVNPIAATMILESATVNGVFRSTTATNMSWRASGTN